MTCLYPYVIVSLHITKRVSGFYSSVVSLKLLYLCYTMVILSKFLEHHWGDVLLVLIDVIDKNLILMLLFSLCFSYLNMKIKFSLKLIFSSYYVLFLTARLSSNCSEHLAIHNLG